MMCVRIWYVVCVLCVRVRVRTGLCPLRMLVLGCFALGKTRALLL